MADEDEEMQREENGFDSLYGDNQTRTNVSGTATPRRPESQAPFEHLLNAGSAGQTPPRQHVRTPAPDVLDSGNRFHPDASLVLVGIRASGKRSLGLIAATALGWRFVTEDHYFQTINGLSRQDYLKLHGSEQFHRQDIQTSKQMLEENKYHCVIDCGLGSLTSGVQEHLRRYSQTNPVVFVVRDMSRIKQVLNLDDRSAKLLENGNSTHKKCSNYEFYNLEDESMNESADAETTDRASPVYSFKLRNAQADFSSFVKLVAGPYNNGPSSLSPFSLEVPVESRAFTHALFVTLSDFVSGRVDFSLLEAAGDVLEINVDKVLATTSVLAKMVAMARRALGLPILFSVNRRLSETTSTERYLAILWQGIRLGVEYMCVDLSLDDARIEQLKLIKGRTKLIATYRHFNTNGASWKDKIFFDMYKRAASLKFDMIRLLNVPASREENEMAIWFSEQLKGLDGPRLACISYNVGPLGQTSQVMNFTLTSVTHPSISGSPVDDEHAWRPLLSSRDIIHALFESFMFDPLHFYIVGANVSGSLSPAMHNAAYELLGLKHQYSTKNIRNWKDIEELAKDDTLGGLSIVQPYKVQLIPHMYALSRHAKAIGALNTLIPLRTTADRPLPDLDAQALYRNRAGRIVGWFGENTDFIGILNCVKRSLSPRNAVQPRTTSLVLGAGGMARAAVYAMLQLGCKHIFVYNRTFANTTALARHFNDSRTRNGGTSTPSPEYVKVLKSTTDPWPADFAPPTIVVSCVTREVLDGNPGADFEIPEPWLQSPSGGVVVEMAYMSKETSLTKQMKRFREATQRPWVLVDGIETLIEQAVGQFESMTGRKAPKRCMADAAHAAIRNKMSYIVDGEEFFT